MNLDKRGVVIGFIAGAAGGGVAGILDLSLLKGIPVVIGTSIIVALFINLIWD